MEIQENDDHNILLVDIKNLLIFVNVIVLNAYSYKLIQRACDHISFAEVIQQCRVQLT